MEQQILEVFIKPVIRKQFAIFYQEGLKMPKEDIDYEIEFMLKNSKDYSIDDPEWKAYNEDAYKYAITTLLSQYI